MKGVKMLKKLSSKEVKTGGLTLRLFSFLYMSNMISWHLMKEPLNHLPASW